VPNSAIEGVAFSPDGKTLAITYGFNNAKGTVELRDPVAGQLLLAPGQFDYYVNSLAFAPDGETIATANNDGTITVCDRTTLQTKLMINTKTDNVQKLAIPQTASASSLITVTTQPVAGRPQRQIRVRIPLCQAGRVFF